MDNKKIYNIYKSYWLRVTILGVVLWTIGHFCKDNHLGHCAYSLYYGVIYHILFGIWVFMSLCLFSRFLIAKFDKKGIIDNLTIFVLIIILSLLVALTNEFTNADVITGVYKTKAFYNDIYNTLCDVIGVLLVVLFHFYLAKKYHQKS